MKRDGWKVSVFGYVIGLDQPRGGLDREKQFEWTLSRFWAVRIDCSAHRLRAPLWGKEEKVEGGG